MKIADILSVWISLLCPLSKGLSSEEFCVSVENNTIGDLNCGQKTNFIMKWYFDNLDCSNKDRFKNNQHEEKFLPFRINTSLILVTFYSLKYRYENIIYTCKSEAKESAGKTLDHSTILYSDDMASKREINVTKPRIDKRHSTLSKNITSSDVTHPVLSTVFYSQIHVTTMETITTQKNDKRYTLISERIVWILASSFLGIVFCTTVIGCSIYLRLVLKRPRNFNAEKSKPNKASNHASNTNTETVGETSEETDTINSAQDDHTNTGVTGDTGREPQTVLTVPNDQLDTETTEATSDEPHTGPVISDNQNYIEPCYRSSSNENYHEYDNVVRRYDYILEGEYERL